MICPHCGKNIPDKDIAKHLASKGGKAGTGKKKSRGDRKYYKELARKSALARKKKEKKCIIH